MQEPVLLNLLLILLLPIAFNCSAVRSCIIFSLLITHTVKHLESDGA